jgi:hypothetical protein
LPALGYFVAKPTIDGISDAIASRPAPTEPSGNLQINAPNADTVNVPPRPAEAATDLQPTPRRPASAIKTLKA